MSEAFIEAGKDPEELRLIGELFNVVTTRLSQAMRLQRDVPHYKHVLFDRDPQTWQRTLEFDLVDDFALHRVNKGEILRVKVPIDERSSTADPTTLISVENPERFFMVERLRGDSIQRFAVTNWNVEITGDEIHETVDFGTEANEQAISMNERLMSLMVALNFYQPVPIRPSSAA